MTESRRAYYRVTYPLMERPTFEVEGGRFEVVECSERGLRYQVANSGPPAIAAELKGTIEFRRGGKTDVAGQVIRSQGGEVVLILDKRGIPFADVLLEQQYLRSKGYTLAN
jgi:hypothetical protein